MERNRAQIVVDMCGIKFCKDDFTVDSAYAKMLFSRIEKVAEATSRKRSIVSVLITTKM